jgi:hypothetical protein
MQEQPRARGCDIEFRGWCEAINYPKIPVGPRFTVPPGLYLSSNKYVILLVFSRAEEPTSRDV